MSTFLFDKIIFGPVQSRRLGTSLGINLLPADKKYCNFNCIYCECGWSNLQRIVPSDFPTRIQVKEALKVKLEQMKEEGQLPDVITFAGNGEPTVHPEFAGIIDDTIEMRGNISPDSRIAVLSNSTMLYKNEVALALNKVDQNILKLDTAIPETFKILNRPAPGIDFDALLRTLIYYPGRKILQTMFLRGTVGESIIDNTTNEELNCLIDAYRRIKPEYVMIYTFERSTPANDLVKILHHELLDIAKRIERTGIRVEVSS